jgi:serine/threonine-protein kinase
MPIDSVPALVGVVNQNQLLDPPQQRELEALQHRFTDPRLLLKEMVQRGWLTPFQANRVLQNTVKDLILGPYLILSRISDGGLGPVYKAMHRRMKRLVALKVIRAELLAREEAVQRFYEETQIISQLSEPHIVHAYDAGPVGKTHFFAMEYVEGIDLETLVGQAGPLPLEAAAEFVVQTAEGLQHACERNVIHGDLKPANLLVSRPVAQGAVASPALSWRSLLASSAGGGALVKINNLGLTFLQAPGSDAPVAGAAQVSADYLAPERWQGSAGDIRADLYSLGCIWYFMLSGRVPFPDGTPADKMRRHQTEEPVPLQQLRKDAPAPVVAMITRLMAKRPAMRYQVPAELIQALRGSRSAPQR